LTGGGGIHLFFKAHSGVKNSVSKVADKVDIRGEGGKIVVAPSVHRSGVVYEWARSPLEHKLPIMPLWVLKHLEKRDAEKQRRQYQADRDAGLKVTKDQARERIDRFALELAGMKADSGRNNTLNRNAFIGFRLARESGLSTHEVEHTFLSAAKACGLDHMSSLKTIKSAERSAFSKP
jgi:hypothetical protein